MMGPLPSLHPEGLVWRAAPPSHSGVLDADAIFQVLPHLSGDDLPQGFWVQSFRFRVHGSGLRVSDS